MAGRKSRGRKPSGAGVDLPDVNSSVELLADDWAGPARSRVEDSGDGTVVVARPSHAGSTPVSARPGDVLVLAWTTDQAMYELPVELAEVDLGHVPTWRLRPRGKVRRRQRRGAFRLEVALSARLGTPSQAAGIAQVHDLSEGGLRCTPPDGFGLAAGDAVWVELSLPEATVKLDATVARVSDHGEVGLAFQGVEEATAEQVRSHLFAEQLARRARLAT